MKQIWYCIECKDEVEMHFDHVGECGKPGYCSGTFSHLPGGTCRLRYTDLRHAQVTKEKP